MAVRNPSWPVRIIALACVLVALGLLASLRVEVPEAPRVSTLPSSEAVPVVEARSRSAGPRPRSQPRSAPTPELLQDTGSTPSTAVLELRVEGRGVPYPTDCRVVGVLERGPSMVVVEVEPGLCVVRGVRYDGALMVYGDEVAVALDAGDTMDVDLPMPRYRTGGIGVRFRPTADGVRVVEVVPGSPAYGAGLETGDLILEVDGVATSELSANEFVSVMTGEEGSDVSFVIGFEADTGWTEEVIDVTRAYLSG